MFCVIALCKKNFFGALAYCARFMVGVDDKCFSGYLFAYSVITPAYVREHMKSFSICY